MREIYSNKAPQNRKCLACLARLEAIEFAASKGAAMACVMKWRDFCRFLLWLRATTCQSHAVPEYLPRKLFMSRGVLVIVSRLEY